MTFLTTTDLMRSRAIFRQTITAREGSRMIMCSRRARMAQGRTMPTLLRQQMEGMEGCKCSSGTTAAESCSIYYHLKRWKADTNHPSLLNLELYHPMSVLKGSWYWFKMTAGRIRALAVRILRMVRS